MSWPSTAARIIGSGLAASTAHLLRVLYLVTWDTGLALLNLITPKKGIDAWGAWPEYMPRTKGDSRSPCPGLNALANHGILPHDGRNIAFTQLAAAVQKHYNCAPTFCKFTTDYMARILRREYSTDKLDLSDMCVHNGIEHDGSITRHDTLVQPDQSYPDEGLINDLISASKDGKTLTAADLSHVIGARLAYSKQTNGQFSLTVFHASFAAGNAATLLLLLGGDVADIKPFLLEERIPEGWTTKFRARMGLTMAHFNATSLRVLLGIDPAWKTIQKAM